MNRIGWDQMVRRPVDRVVKRRVLPRLLKGGRPPVPKPATFSYGAPLELTEVPVHWREDPVRGSFDVPYATGPLVLPVPALPVAAMGALALDLPPLVPHHNNVHWLQLASMSAHEHSLFLRHEYDVRFLLSRKDLFYFYYSDFL